MFQVLAAGFLMGKGQKKGADRPYEFSKLLVLVEGTDFKNADHNIRKAGCEVQEINCAFDDTLLAKAKGLKFPLHLNVDIRPLPSDMSKTIAVDFSPVSVSSPAQSPNQGK